MQRSGPPVPLFQRPNVRRALWATAVTLSVGYVISRVGVIGEGEAATVAAKYGSVDHSKTQLYEAIRDAENRLKSKKQ